jgi:quinol monooxygenase YgiN
MTTTPLLTIAFPTTQEREKQFKEFVFALERQIAELELVNGEVEIIYDKTGKEMPVGKKRDLLYKRAKGLYTFMPDDDDSVATDFIKRVIEGIRTNPDCITYFEHVDIDGNISKSNHSILYSGWHDNPTWPEGFKYARTPYFKDVIKTEVAQMVQVPELRWNEDEQWANALHPHLKNEFHIDEYMYFYKTISENPTEKYGLDK